LLSLCNNKKGHLGGINKSTLSFLAKPLLPCSYIALPIGALWFLICEMGGAAQIGFSVPEGVPEVCRKKFFLCWTSMVQRNNPTKFHVNRNCLTLLFTFC